MGKFDKKRWLYRALRSSGLGHVYQRFRPAAGLILMFHRVVHRLAEHAFAPNDQFSVTPEVLSLTIDRLRESGFDLVDLDEAHRRLGARPDKGSRPFACLTFDDGYRDNAELAWPICAAKQAPMAVYVTSGFVDRSAPIWWYGLERLIDQQQQVTVRTAQGEQRFDTRDVSGQHAALAGVGGILRAAPLEQRVRMVRQLSEDHGFDVAGEAAEWAMDWPELVEFANRDGVTIGAHTATHPSLADLSEDAARAEIAEGRDVLEQRLACPVRHLAFPYGDVTTTGPREVRLARELGFATATTTRHGLVHGDEDQCALPRVPTDPFDDARTVAVKASGLPAALLRARSSGSDALR